MKDGYDRFFHMSKKQTTSKGRAPRRPPPASPQNIRRAPERRGFPWLGILILGTSSCVFGWFYENPDSFKTFMSHANSISISLFGQAIAKDADGKKVQEEPHASEKKSATEAAPAPVEAEKKKSWTEEEVALFRHLETRKKELDQREDTLKKLEEELQKQKGEVAMRLQQLEETRKKISGQLESKVQTDIERVEKLVAFYSNMKPQSAAKVFQDLNEDLVVELLQKMKQKNAADIMNLLPSEKAQKLTERFAGYRRN
jgi:flagellar motility protein MotE (MotC chaperone)